MATVSSNRAETRGFRRWNQLLAACAETLLKKKKNKWPMFWCQICFLLMFFFAFGNFGHLLCGSVFFGDFAFGKFDVIDVG